MPCAVTVFSVKIASPGDAAMELIIAREVICEWNARRALAEKRVLLPIYGEEENGACAPSDMLITFFCGSQGMASDWNASGSEEEIDKQLQAGKPALVYFSEGRVDFMANDAVKPRALDDFTLRYADATVDAYGDEKEFRAKFTRNLDSILSSHPHLKVGEEARSAAPPSIPAPLKLSDWARVILIEACDDFEGYIGRIKIGGMLKIQANGKQLVEQGNAEAAAKWESAFQELLTGEYIRDAGCNGQLFQISTQGFDFLKSIGKTPVGYIAELGGM